MLIKHCLLSVGYGFNDFIISFNLGFTSFRRFFNFGATINISWFISLLVPCVVVANTKR